MKKNKNNIEYESKKIFYPFKIFYILLNRANHYIASINLKNCPQIAIYSFDHIGLNINLYGIYEKDNLNIIFDYLLFKYDYDKISNSCALDVGANIGNHSLFFSKYFKHVYSFEPNPRTFDLLYLNSKYKNISPLNFGLGSINAFLKFKTSSLNIGGSKVINSNDDSLEDDEIYVNIQRLDDVDLISNQSIFLIKIDVEGHELDVIRGARNTIEKNLPVILFEQHKYDFLNGKSPVSIELESLGYHFFIIDNKFSFKNNFFEKYFSLFLHSLFGFKKVLRRVDYFNNKFYELIIAIPIDFKK